MKFPALFLFIKNEFQARNRHNKMLLWNNNEVL